VDVADVGPLPTKPPPKAGERLHLELAGRPPTKTISRSMRNPSSTQRARFMALRLAAIEAMAGRKWFEEAVELRLVYRAPQPGAGLAYMSGIMDTIGGSHGPSFIYLPIVYLDDCQVVISRFSAEIASTENYELDVTFLGG
jgi:hypothetical protein